MLKPKSLFLILSSFYFAVLILGFFVVFVRMIIHGHADDLTSLHGKPAWYTGLIWSLEVLGLLLSLYGIYTFNKVPKNPCPPPLPKVE